jgi:hypothetical protein
MLLDAFMEEYIRDCESWNINYHAINPAPSRATKISYHHITLEPETTDSKMAVNDQMTNAPTPNSDAKGMTAFEPQDGLSNILITGGGGFM